jgi:hypothetical protein
MNAGFLIGRQHSASRVERRCRVPQHLDPELLQALEHTLEALTRMSDVLRTTLDAMERGHRLSDRHNCRLPAQLKTVDADRQRMEQLLRLLWSTVQSQ